MGTQSKGFSTATITAITVIKQMPIQSLPNYFSVRIFLQCFFLAPPPPNNLQLSLLQNKTKKKKLHKVLHN